MTLVIIKRRKVPRSKGVALDKRQLQREIDADLKKQAKQKIQVLRDKLASARARRSRLVNEMVAHCKTAREAARDRARERRAALNATIRAEQNAASETCKRQIKAARNSEDVEQARAELGAERRDQAELRRIRQGNEARRKQRQRATGPTRSERRQESDDEVLSNLEPEYHALWRKKKREIRGSNQMSRTEAFYHWVHNHPREAAAIVHADVDDQVNELVKQLEAAEHEYDDLYVEGVPF